jgi:hypothetical protein
MRRHIKVRESPMPHPPSHNSFLSLLLLLLPQEVDGASACTCPRTTLTGAPASASLTAYSTRTWTSAAARYAWTSSIRPGAPCSVSAYLCWMHDIVMTHDHLTLASPVFTPIISLLLCRLIKHLRVLSASADAVPQPGQPSECLRRLLAARRPRSL